MPVLDATSEEMAAVFSSLELDFFRRGDEEFADELLEPEPPFLALVALGEQLAALPVLEVWQHEEDVFSALEIDFFRRGEEEFELGFAVSDGAELCVA
jgi:hypothetical protein